MTKRLICLFFALTCLCFVILSCTDDSPQKTTPTVSEIAKPSTTPFQAPLDPPKDLDIVSKYAREDFLLPLNEYSWDREYPVEFVVLHFS